MPPSMAMIMFAKMTIDAMASNVQKRALISASVSMETRKDAGRRSSVPIIIYSFF